MKWTMTTTYKAKPPAGWTRQRLKNCKKEPSNVEEDQRTPPDGKWGERNPALHGTHHYL